MQVMAVGHAIGLLESLKELVLKGNARDHLAGEGATHLLRAGPPRVCKHGVLQPKLVKSAEDIRPKLDAGADFAECAGLLEYANGKTFAREGVGRGQPADPSADHQKRKLVRHCLNHPDSQPPLQKVVRILCNPCLGEIAS